MQRNPKRTIDPRPKRPQRIRSSDYYVDPNGLLWLTNPHAGLNILQLKAIERYPSPISATRSGNGN